MVGRCGKNTHGRVSTRGKQFAFPELRVVDIVDAVLICEMSFQLALVTVALATVRLIAHKRLRRTMRQLMTIAEKQQKMILIPNKLAIYDQWISSILIVRTTVSPEH